LSRVLKLWEGLGYYTRARNLHRAAKIVARAGFANFRELPGVGRYTAGAIASIAFDERAALVDGNVARVFARVFNIRANVKRPATQRRLWALAEALLLRVCGTSVPLVLPPLRQPHGQPGRLSHVSPGEFNQALMELGALVCLPANPRCGECPLRSVCAAPGDELPNRGPKQRVRRVTEDVMLARRDGKVLLRRRPMTGLLAGMWELPPREGNGGRLLFTLRHAITNRRITLRVFEGTARDGRWMSPRAVTMPAAHRRALNAEITRDTSRHASGAQRCR
jgi:A/G-specific adenine glycosylase